MVGQHREFKPEFNYGDAVIVTGDVQHSGECGTVCGFVRRSTHLTNQALYAVRFADDSEADFPAENLKIRPRSRKASS